MDGKFFIIAQSTSENICVTPEQAEEKAKKFLADNPKVNHVFVFEAQSVVERAVQPVTVKRLR